MQKWMALLTCETVCERNKEDKMITITRDGGVVTLINVFSCDPQNQQRLIDFWIRATEETLGKFPGIISAVLH